MMIKFLGNWSSHLGAGHRNSSIIINDRTVMDFGPHSMESLLEKGIDPGNIDAVLITHLHLDHFMGLPELLWYRGSTRVKNVLTVMGPKGIGNAMDQMMKLINTPLNDQYEINVEYVEGKKLDFISVYDGNHIIPDNVYRLDYPEVSIVYTGDTAYSLNVVRAAEDADYLFHEMTYTDEEKERAQLWKHSTYSSVMDVFSDSHCKNLIPTHLTQKSFDLVMEQSKKSAQIIAPVADMTV
ncbi:MAG: MBL fold metallo-hydrolase [Thermoplasmataceae archaeon]